MAQCGVAMGENNGMQWRPVIEPSAHDASKYFRLRQKTTPGHECHHLKTENSLRTNGNEILLIKENLASQHRQNALIGL